MSTNSLRLWKLKKLNNLMKKGVFEEVLDEGQKRIQKLIAVHWGSKYSTRKLITRHSKLCSTLAEKKRDI